MSWLNRALAVLATVLGMTFLVLANFKSAPVVLADEWIYRSQVAFISVSEHGVPNYLYSWVYSITNLFGDSFYRASQVINLGFFLVFCLLVFAIANHYLERHVALWISLATLVSPLNLYVGLHMPEAMYFAFVTGAILVYMRSIRASHPGLEISLFAASIALLLASSFIKPHGLFFAFLFSVYFLWRKLRAGSPFLAIGTTLASLTFLVSSKLAIGFAVAGPAGLTLFGSGYERVFFELLVSSTRAPSALVAMPAGPTGIDMANQNIEAESLDFSSLLVAIALIAAVVLPIHFANRRSLDGEPRELADFLLFLFAGVLSVVVAFQVAISFSGDDHTERFLLRHIELLVPLLMIPSFAAIGKRGGIKPLVVPLLIASAGLSALAISGSRMLSDSALLFALASTSWLPVLLITFLGVLATIATKPNRRDRVAVSVVFVAIIGLSFGAQGALDYRNLSSEQESFAYQMRSNVDSASEVNIYASRKQNAAYFLFLLNRGYNDYDVLSPGSLVNLEEQAPGSKHVLIGELISSGPAYEELFVGDSRFLAVTSETTFSPGARLPMVESVTPTPAMDRHGLLINEDSLIEFRNPVQPGETLVVGMQGTSELCGAEDLLFVVSGEAIPVSSLEFGTVENYVFNFSTNSPWSELRVVLVSPGCSVGITEIGVER